MPWISLDNVSQLIGICRQQRQVHHSLREILFLLIHVYVGYNVAAGVRDLKSLFQISQILSRKNTEMVCAQSSPMSSQINLI